MPATSLAQRQLLQARAGHGVAALGAGSAAEGGETEYADLRAAWDALAGRSQSAGSTSWWRAQLRLLAGLIGYDPVPDAERAEVPPCPRRLVRTHPATGRKALYVGSHASHIIAAPSRRAARSL